MARLIELFISFCRCDLEYKRGRIRRGEILGNYRRQAQRGPVGVGAVSQRSIPMVNQSLLQMRTATTESVFVVRADKKLSALVELERVGRESLRFPNVE